MNNFSIDKWAIREKKDSKSLPFYVLLTVFIVITTLLLEFEVEYRMSMAHLPKVHAMDNKTVCQKFLNKEIRISGNQSEITSYCKSI